MDGPYSMEHFEQQTSFPIDFPNRCKRMFCGDKQGFFHPYGEDTGEGDHCGIPLTHYSMTAPMDHCIYYLLELTTHNWSAGVYRSVGRSTGGVYSPNVIIYNT